MSDVRPLADASGSTRVWLTGKALRSLVAGTVVRATIIVAVHASAVAVPPTAVVWDTRNRRWCSWAARPRSSGAPWP